VVNLIVIVTDPKLTDVLDSDVRGNDQSMGRIDDRICQGTESNPVNLSQIINLHQDFKEIQRQHRQLNPLEGQRLTVIGNPFYRVSAPDKEDKRSHKGSRLMGIYRHFPCHHLQSHLTSPG